MEFNFTGMQKEHIDQVVEIERLSFPTPWSAVAFRQEIDSNDLAYYIVALENTKVIGYAGMWVILDEGHVTTLAVDPAYRQQGIGESLLINLIQEARRRFCLRMTLEARPSNYHALHLYEKKGFISYGLRPGYYSDTGEDAVIMWKEISQV